MRPDPDEHRLLAVWAADCAERALPRFEAERPDDNRPRAAIGAARAWARGNLAMVEARKAAFAAHAAARESPGPAAVAAARSAGHAAATAHVPAHATHAAGYAAKSAEDPAAEREWQGSHLPEDLRLRVFGETGTTS